MPFTASDFDNQDLWKIYQEILAGGGGGGLSFWEEAEGTDVGGRTYSLFTPIAGNESVILVPRNNGGIYVDVPDGGVIGGNARGGNSNDLQHVRTAASQVASGLRSTIVGGEQNTSGGIYSVTGGLNNNAAGSYSCAFGGGNSAQNYSFAAGFANSALGSFSVVFGSNNSQSAESGATLGRYTYGDLDTSINIGNVSRIGVGYRNRTFLGNMSTVTLLADANRDILGATNTYTGAYNEIILRGANETMLVKYGVVCRATTTSGVYTLGDSYTFEQSVLVKNVSGLGSIVYTSAPYNNGGDASLSALGLTLSFSIVAKGGFQSLRTRISNKPVSDSDISVSVFLIGCNSVM